MRSIIMLIYHPSFLTPHATLPCSLASGLTRFAQCLTFPLLHNLPINNTTPTPSYDRLLTLDSSSQ